MRLQRIDLDKHDNKYLNALVADIENRKPILLGNQGEDSVTITNIDDVLRNRSAEEFAKLKLIGSDGRVYTYRDIFKGAYSQRSLDPLNQLSRKLNANIDDLREVLTACAIAANLQGKSLGEKFDTSRIKSGTIDVDHLLESTRSNVGLIKRYNNYGVAFVTNAPKFHLHIKQYEIHHKTQQVDTLRRNGSRLTRLTADKWNPADLYFIKPHLEIPKTFNTINNLNRFLIDHNIYSLSLKEEKAMHGSGGLMRIINHLGHNFKDVGWTLDTTKNDEAYNEYVSWVVDKVKVIKTIQPKAQFFIQSKGSSIIKTMVELKPILAKKENYWKSIPTILEFLSTIKITDDLISVVYNYCNSTLKESAGHFKLVGSKALKYIKGSASCHLKDIYIPLNGDTQVLFVVDVVYQDDDNKTITKQQLIQLRSKSSKPQFIILDRNNVSWDATRTNITEKL